MLLIGCLALCVRIKGQNNQAKIWVKPKTPLGNGDKYGETTYEAHELDGVRQLVHQILIGVVITSLIHFKAGIQQILVLQCAMMPLTFYDAPMVRKYFFGDKTRVYAERLEGESLDPVEPVEAIEEEKTDKGGKKKKRKALKAKVQA
eukprot:CAMPEP_0119504848 /NCGR_PEP_ID=MMETSP1344-20130328/25574_1 /TAXON_ID=236787 /ORGANISM="Florenciella parvula, Strain CCMP2471" /LENGTH=146 /DNA_ID=CAMNT_0007541257 /DNA_START=1 /DNA_END=438 /DNA_ORIENTATION=-